MAPAFQNFFPPAADMLLEFVDADFFADAWIIPLVTEMTNIRFQNSALPFSGIFQERFRQTSVMHASLCCRHFHRSPLPFTWRRVLPPLRLCLSTFSRAPRSPIFQEGVGACGKAPLFTSFHCAATPAPPCSFEKHANISIMTGGVVSALKVPAGSTFRAITDEAGPVYPLRLL